MKLIGIQKNPITKIWWFLPKVKYHVANQPHYNTNQHFVIVDSGQYSLNVRGQPVAFVRKVWKPPNMLNNIHCPLFVIPDQLVHIYKHIKVLHTFLKMFLLPNFYPNQWSLSYILSIQKWRVGSCLVWKMGRLNISLTSKKGWDWALIVNLLRNEGLRKKGFKSII